jgi:hypothetical protein
MARSIFSKVLSDLCKHFQIDVEKAKEVMNQVSAQKGWPNTPGSGYTREALYGATVRVLINEDNTPLRPKDVAVEFSEDIQTVIDGMCCEFPGHTEEMIVKEVINACDSLEIRYWHRLFADTQSALISQVRSQILGTPLPTKPKTVAARFSKDIEEVIQVLCSDFPLERKVVESVVEHVYSVYAIKLTDNLSPVEKRTIMAVCRQELKSLQDHKYTPTSDPPDTRPNYQWMWEKLEKIYEADTSVVSKVFLKVMEKIGDEARKSAKESAELKRVQGLIERSLLSGPSISMLREGPSVESCRIHFKDGSKVVADLSLKAVKTILGSMTQEWVDKL